MTAPLLRVKVTDTLRLVTARWEDPGDYPCALASEPLESYSYVESVAGTVRLEPLLDGDVVRPEDIDQAIDEEVPIGWHVHRWDTAYRPDGSVELTPLAWDQDALDRLVQEGEL